LSQTDSGECGPQTAQRLEEEFGSLTAGPGEQKVPGTPRASLRSSKVTQMPWAGAFSIIIGLSEGEEKMEL